MKKLILFFLILSAFDANSQEFDFGIDLRINQNKLGNRWSDREGAIIPGFQSNSLDDFQIPGFNFGYYNDEGEAVYVRFNEVNMLNNFEVPISLRYTTKNQFFFGFKFSGGNHYLEYDGTLFRDQAYYTNQFGTYEDYNTQYGGTFNGQPVNGDPNTTYDDTTAYINWFNSQVALDPYSQSRAKFVEEFKFRSFHLWFGRKFLKHKRVHPFINIGIHWRTSTQTFRRRHFEIDNSVLGQSFTRTDLTELTEDIPSFSKNAFGFGIGVGFDIYRYHFAATAEYSINLNGNFKDKEYVFEQVNTGLGFRTLNISIGVDLFSHDFKTKNNTEEVYTEEFKSVSANLNKTRSWSLGINVKTPIVSRMNAGREFSLLTIKDNPDPSSGELNTIWQSLSFSDIGKINWIPKFEIGLRFNIVKRLDFEIATAFSQVKFDTKVVEFNGRTINNNTVFDSTFSSLNSAVYRFQYTPISLGLNIYFTAISKPTVDLRFYAGIYGNWFALNTPGAKSEFGVNGSGNDIYQTMEDYMFHGTYSPEEVYNGSESYYSNYAGKPNPDLEPQQMLGLYDAAGRFPLSTTSKGQKTLYPTVNAGFELELNRFLFGLSGDWSIIKVDNFLVDNYVNVTLNLGYVLVSKTKIKKKK